MKTKQHTLPALRCPFFIYPQFSLSREKESIYVCISNPNEILVSRYTKIRFAPAECTLDSERVKLRSASQRFLCGKTIDESLFARRVERKGIGEERMQENVEMRKEREVYLKIVRKWLGKRSAACFRRRRRISHAWEIFRCRTGKIAYAMRISFCRKKSKKEERENTREGVSR